jgi:DNA-binding response OmpR family regulator
VVLIVGGGLPVSPGYDLVVIDLMRPELDGFDGGRAIRASALAGQ